MMGPLVLDACLASRKGIPAATRRPREAKTRAAERRDNPFDVRFGGSCLPFIVGPLRPN
jgi:hypothetical protein